MVLTRGLEPPTSALSTRRLYQIGLREHGSLPSIRTRNLLIQSQAQLPVVLGGNEWGDVRDSNPLAPGSQPGGAPRCLTSPRSLDSDLPLVDGLASSLWFPVSAHGPSLGTVVSTGWIRTSVSVHVGPQGIEPCSPD